MPAIVNSILSNFHIHVTFDGLAAPQSALMTTAASTASGNHWNAGARNARVRSTRPARMMFATWVFAPADAAAAVFDRLPATAMPPRTPAPRLERPRARNSWSESS